MERSQISQAAADLAKRKQSWIPFVTPNASHAGHVLAEAKHTRKSSRASSRSKSTARASSRKSTRASAKRSKKAR